MARVRLDQLLVTRGLAATRTKAQALLMAGSVRVGGQPAAKPGMLVEADAVVEVSAGLPYVSRGGYKLAHALDCFALDPHGLTALDVGASTGGFTDVLLQREAGHVFAVDVGYGILDYRLRNDPRVTAIERTNIRWLTALPHAVRADCAVIDVAFISLQLVLPAVQALISPGAWIVALIKPQFEAGANLVGKGGVVRDPHIHRAVLEQSLHFAASLGLPACGLVPSPITGPAGNREFLAWLQPGGPALADLAEAARRNAEGDS